MHYIFVINGREDIRPRIDASLDSQLSGLSFDYEKYYTKGIGDGTRFTRIHCDLHPRQEVCFVACGGSGTVNEVASGIAGFEGKSMAVLSFGSTNDFLKYYPGYDFNSVKKILNGTITKIDVIKANDYYSVNVINCGFDAYVAHEGNMLYERHIYGAKAYRRSLFTCLLHHFINPIRITVDGKPLNKRNMLLCSFCNGRWVGGQYKCAPYAVNDDGLMDVCFFKPSSLFAFAKMISIYEKGEHLGDPYCQRHMIFCRGRKATIDSNNLVYIALDGQTVAARHFDLEVLDKHISLVLPKKD